MTTYLYFLPYHKILKAFPKKFPTEIKQRTQKPNTREKMWQEKRKKSRAFPNFRSSKKAAECSTYKTRFGQFWLTIYKIPKSKWVIKKWAVTFFSSLTFLFSSFHSCWWEQNTKLWGSWLNNKMKIWVLAAAVPGASESQETVCITCIPLACLHS